MLTKASVFVSPLLLTLLLVATRESRGEDIPAVCAPTQLDLTACFDENSCDPSTFDLPDDSEVIDSPTNCEEYNPAICPFVEPCQSCRFETVAFFECVITEEEGILPEQIELFQSCPFTCAKETQNPSSTTTVVEEDAPELPESGTESTTETVTENPEEDPEGTPAPTVTPQDETPVPTVDVTTDAPTSGATTDAPTTSAEPTAAPIFPLTIAQTELRLRSVSNLPYLRRNVNRAYGFTINRVIARQQENALNQRLNYQPANYRLRVGGR